MNTIALITGASSGIGKELALHFAELGHDLILVARSEQKLKELADAIRSKNSVIVHVLIKDLTLPAASREVFDWCQESKLEPDFLINNAGFGHLQAFSESPWERQSGMIQLNIYALTYLTHLFLPGMIARKKGRILNVASTAAFQPGPFFAVYFASKSYVLSFSEALSVELKGTGVSITTLCPGPTQSEFAAVSKADGTNLFKNRSIPTSKEVALFAYRSMIAGKRLAIHGGMNRVMVGMIRFTPRALVLGIARMLMQR
jgi:uncharacterized protein